MCDNRIQIPVLQKNSGEEWRLVLINVEDILFVSSENRHIVFHTKDEKFYNIQNLSDMEELFYPHGFELLDRTNLVNMKMIKHLDNERNLVFFEENPEPTSKFATVAAIHKGTRRENIRRAIARNQNRTIEFKLKQDGSLVTDPTSIKN